MEKLIQTIQQKIIKGSYRTEEAVKTQICLPILRELGWKVDLPEHLVYEYGIDRLRVDIALCHPPEKPAVFIEVKAPDKCSTQGEDQIFGYAAGRGGVPMIILTDGDEWHFYNSYGIGDYKSRKVKSFLLRKDKPDDCVAHFIRYLQYDRVKKGAAFDDLRLDHKKIVEQTEATLKIPEAWRQLVNNSDEMLIEIIVDQVKAITSGEHTPEIKDVVEFLKILKPARQPVKQPTLRSGEASQPKAPPAAPEAEKVTHQYKINSQIHRGRNGKDVYMKVLDYVLAEYGRFEELKNQKFNKMKSRDLGAGYHMSEDRDEIPKGREHKTQLRQSRKWVNTNLSADTMSSKLDEVGRFYSQVENKKILGRWGSGAEVEFDIPTRPSSS